MNPLKILGQLTFTGLLMAGIGYFASAPAYQVLGPEEAIIKVSLSHASRRKEACHQRTPEELAKLPPNMRLAQSCTRERNPVLFEMEVDGRLLMSEWQKPKGLSRDGASNFYKLFRIPAGTHALSIRMNDSGRKEGFDYSLVTDVTLKPAEILVIDFRSEDQAFILK